jgi:hypothetical protein
MTESPTIDELGPIDYLVVEFPEGKEPDGSALVHLLDLIERGIVRVLDLGMITVEADGSVTAIDIQDAGLTGDFDVTLFAEASSGLLDDDDLSEAAGAIEPGRTAAILVYENTWAAPFARALRAQGAQVVANGRIPVQSILATLDALEAGA